MKDHTLLREKISKENQITTKDIISIGYSQYDIKLFVENNILTKVARGLYYYRPLAIEEPTIKEEIKEDTTQTDLPSISKEELSKMINRATTLMVKRETDEAITLFEEILKIENNQYARFSIFACYMFKKDFQTAYAKLIEVYDNRENNELLINLYSYLLLLKELVPVDDRILNDIANTIATEGSNIKRPKTNSYLHKLTKAIREGDWEKAFKYSSINISIDRNQKKYRLTNQCYKFLVVAVVQSKNLFFERTQEEPAPTVDFDEPEEKVIIVPQTSTTETIKQNILLEAINRNDYQTALSILEQEQVDNPLEVIKTLLTKLHSIQSLIVTTEPVKVVQTEEVRVIDENQLVLPEFEDKSNQPIFKPLENQVQTEEPQEIVKPKTEEINPNLTDIAYKAYKEFLSNQNFAEARKNLQRYEYLNNQNGTHRNVKYHYNRIDIMQKDFTANPEIFIKKQQLQEAIYQAKRKKSYDEALSLIQEYKRLGVLVHPCVAVLEAEIYILLNNFQKAELVLYSLKNNEEPSYFIAKARILYEQRKYEECVKMCIEYNERRPSSSAANYIMLSNCYKRLQKPGKAIKALRKAEEINKAKQYTKDLSSDIAALEIQAEQQKEQRLSLTPKKK